MILLDTNVLSALMHPESSEQILRWLDRQARSSVWTSSVTLMEIRYGLMIMPLGRRREILEREMENVLLKDIEGRIAHFDAAAAEEAAELMALRKQRGRPGELRDTMIAGIALATRATLATRNVAHFADLTVAVVNPWAE